ncbi:hypothetical protein CYMTET_30680 [Cymbomonas tetramitiformis]|uniref:D-isomer specific 2-hydroxyacid dehydrogenase catalytic domain-containing protein n=1 Tax=Cymbomonas tetramitiformis TaxID=36881 RepID=A0AAE0KTQ1_9CHLO|nr:hypothetical protein CYMTET_30680 [Cymbomonas tetramitiformis]
MQPSCTCNKACPEGCSEEIETAESKRADTGLILDTDELVDDRLRALIEGPSSYGLVQAHLSEAQLAAGALAEYDAVLIRSPTQIPADAIEAAFARTEGCRLKVIGRAGVGVDNVAVKAATEHHVAVLNVPSASTQSVVELTVAHILNCARKVPLADSAVKNGEWPRNALWSAGTELHGKRIGLVGFGHIARGVARVVQALGMEVHVFTPSALQSVSKRAEIEAAGYVAQLSVDALFASCTHVSTSRYHPVAIHICNLDPAPFPSTSVRRPASSIYIQYLFL